MATNKAEACVFCKQGPVTWRLEEMSFWQASDKGYVHCRVELPVGTCDKCGSKSLNPDSDEVFDACFKREYDKLR